MHSLKIKTARGDDLAVQLPWGPFGCQARGLCASSAEGDSWLILQEAALLPGHPERPIQEYPKVSLQNLSTFLQEEPGGQVCAARHRAGVISAVRSLEGGG